MATYIKPDAIKNNSIDGSKIKNGTLSASKIDETIASKVYIDTQVKTIDDEINSFQNAGYLYAGVATIDTNPGTPDAKVFYIANGKGTYTNFGGLEVTEDEVVVLYWDTAWHKVSTGIASQEKLSELDAQINGASFVQPTEVKSGYLMADGSYVDATNTHHIIADVATFKGRKLTADSNTIVQYGFLKTYDTTSISSWSSTIGRTTGKPIDVTIPNDAVYLYLYIGAYSTIPTINVDKIDGIVDDLSSIKEDVQYAKNKVDTILPSTTKEETISITKADCDSRDGYYIGDDGTLTALNSYITFLYHVNHNGTFFFDEQATTSNLLFLMVYSGEPSSATKKSIRYRNTDNNLPYQSNPINVESGDVIAISLFFSVSSSQLNFYGNYNYHIEINDTLGEDIKLNNNQIKQVLSKNSIHIKYVNGAGLDNSTEKVEVYIPTNKGFIRYDFLHCVNTGKVANVWRMGYAYSVNDDLSNAQPLTIFGEWECALKLSSADDYSGGVTHGYETLNSIRFFVDNALVDIGDMTTLTQCHSFSVIENSNLYEHDGTSIFAEHGSKHIWSIDGLVIKQSINWKMSVNLGYCYLAMHLPLKAYTDRMSIDSKIGVSNVSFGLFDNTKSLDIFGETSGLFTHFEVGEYPKLANGGSLLIADNGGNPYNKCYYVITSGASVSNGDLWKSETLYKFDKK